jgi:deoxyribodipyrimidine photo-lyase
MSDNSVVWFRRDLRVADQPTFLAAAEQGPALALFVLDDALGRPSGPARRTFLYRSLRVLDEQLGGRLLVVRGDPVDVVPRVAAAVDARSVHVAADFGPYGARRDEGVAKALAEQDRDLVRTGSPYAVAPGRVRKADGEPFKVFTPFRRAWAGYGWRPPADTEAGTVHWLDPGEKDGGPRAVRVPDDDPAAALPAGMPAAGEDAARARWRAFLDDGIDSYGGDRNRPDRDRTSRMSVYLKYGQVHPRTLLAELAEMAGERASTERQRGRGGPSPESTSGAGERSESADTYRTELAWRDFYADVLHHHPRSARENHVRAFDALPIASGKEADADFEAWQAGRTGFPIVDAGMRQLLAQGWMHNRPRMIVASFLVKDLHLPWWWGARHFMRHLVDGDLASNQHGWQWTAGSGTDAAPYFRVFNPITQGERFDPDGGYVRRWVPELRGVPGKRVHQPWTLPDGRPDGYPAAMVDHAEERREALARYEAVKAAGR